VYLFVRSHIAKTACSNAQNFLYKLPVAQDRTSFDDNAIRYVRR